MNPYEPPEPPDEQPKTHTIVRFHWLWYALSALVLARALLYWHLGNLGAAGLSALLLLICLLPGLAKSLESWDAKRNT